MADNYHLTEKRVLITGASGGIGQAMAYQLAEQGAKLILVGRNADKLTALAASLVISFQPSEHNQPKVICCDLDTGSGRERVAEECRQNGIDILINNTGFQSFGLFSTQTTQAIEQTIQTNLLSPMLLIHDLLPDMIKRGNGTIVNIGSTFGSIGHPALTSYCASKFGIRGFTEALRRELADTDIIVHYLAPRAINTPLNSRTVNAMNMALGNQSDEPQVVVSALLNLLHQAKGQNCYLGWPEKLFARINGLLPALVDKVLHKQLPIIRRFAEAKD